MAIINLNNLIIHLLSNIIKQHYDVHIKHLGNMLSCALQFQAF